MLGWLERLMIRRSRVVIVICQALETTVREINPSVPTVLIENAPGSGSAPTQGTGAPIRAALGLTPSTPVVLYTGTFEHYQGLDLLYSAMAQVATSRPDARLVMVGGEPAQVDAARNTQVLSDDIAILAEPTPEAFGRAIVGALNDPAATSAIGERARDVANTRYSDEAFMAKTRMAMDQLVRSGRREVAGGLA